MTQRDTLRLQGVHPQLVRVYERVSNAMNAFGYPIFVVEGVRSRERQAELYERGRSQPGAIVTYVDGVAKTSQHQMQSDGFSHAIDFAFVDDPLTPKDETWDSTQPWEIAGAMAQRLGVTWGGAWKMRDLGHLELQVWQVVKA